MAPVIDENTKVLVLGSMPGDISLATQRYYGNRRNHFWKLLFEIFKVAPMDNYQERLEFLLGKGMGLWDVLRQCQRKGSLDSQIRKEKVNDFKTFFQSHSHIKHVIFNGSKAKTSFEKHYDTGDFVNIGFYSLPSTSPVPGRNVKSFQEKLIDWALIKKLIGE